MDDHRKANQKLWDTWTPLNVTSEFYDTEGFKAGRNTLDAVERAGFADVSGRSLLHLQCHFGQDTLSWARLGARVTGVDFSGEAVRAARRLAEEIGVPAEFVQSDIYELRVHLDDQFDHVFTSHGVLGWLPDLRGWAEIVAHYLRPGGSFYIVEAHPYIMMFDEVEADAPLEPTLPYFQGEAPMRFETQGWYAAPDAGIETTSFEWNHTLAEIMGALIGAGLEITSFEEYPFMAWPQFPWMVPAIEGMWTLPPERPKLPLMFSLGATKPEGRA